MPLENETVPVRADDLTVILGLLPADPVAPAKWPPAIAERLSRVVAQLHAEREPVEAEIVPMPPGRWGRVELPGRRDHTGWCNEELRYGVQMLIVRNWDGGEIAAVAIGPACQVLYLPAPLNRPEPAQQRRALAAGDSYAWYGDDDENEGDAL